MLKELIRAIYAIAKAIKNKNNSDGEGGGEESDYKIKLFSYNSEPAGLIAYKDGVGYIGKYYSIEEIFASTPQQIVEIIDANIEEGITVFFSFLYKDDDDVKEGVMTRLLMENFPDPASQNITIDSTWFENSIIRDIELNGETYYFLDPSGGEASIVQPE